MGSSCVSLCETHDTTLTEVPLIPYQHVRHRASLLAHTDRRADTSPLRCVDIQKASGWNQNYHIYCLYLRSGFLLMFRINVYCTGTERNGAKNMTVPGEGPVHQLDNRKGTLPFWAWRWCTEWGFCYWCLCGRAAGIFCWCFLGLYSLDI